MRKLLLSVITLAVLASCQKPDDNSQPTPTPPAPQPVIPADPAKTVLLTSRDDDGNGNLSTTLTGFSTTGAQKWKRTHLGTTSNPFLTCSKGIVYISVGYFQFTGGGSFTSYNNLYAINAETGQNVWAKTNSAEYVYHMAARNDTLYCSIAQGMSNFVGAYSTVNGALLWIRQINFPYPALKLRLDGGTLYFGTASSHTENNIIAFDLATKTIKWNTPVGINLVNGYSSLAIAANAVYLKNGMGNLLALNKATGATLWSKTDQTYEQPVLDNNTLMTATQNGLSAFGAGNGNAAWNWNAGAWSKGGVPAVAGGKVYLTGSQSRGFVICFNAATGSVEWKKEMTDFLQYPVVAADKLFMLRSNVHNTTQPSIMVYDTKTGVARDSIPVSGRELYYHSIVTEAGNWLEGF